MAERIPSQIGDVLILKTDKTFCVYALGLVSRSGQQDLEGQADVKCVAEQGAAVAEAKGLVAPGRRIFIRNIDTNEWSEVSLA